MDDGFRRVLNQELWKFTLHRLSTQEVILLSWTSQRVRDECTITKFVAFYGGRQWRRQLSCGPPTLDHRFFRRWFTNIVVWDTIWNQAERSEERSIRGEQAIPNEHRWTFCQNPWAHDHEAFTQVIGRAGLFGPLIQSFRTPRLSSDPLSAAQITAKEVDDEEGEEKEEEEEEEDD